MVRSEMGNIKPVGERGPAATASGLWVVSEAMGLAFMFGIRPKKRQKRNRGQQIKVLWILQRRQASTRTQQLKQSHPEKKE